MAVQDRLARGRRNLILGNEKSDLYRRDPTVPSRNSGHGSPASSYVALFDLDKMLGELVHAALVESV